MVLGSHVHLWWLIHHHWCLLQFSTGLQLGSAGDQSGHHPSCDPAKPRSFLYYASHFSYFKPKQLLSPPAQCPDPSTTPLMSARKFALWCRLPRQQWKCAVQIYYRWENNWLMSFPQMLLLWTVFTPRPHFAQAALRQWLSMAWHSGRPNLARCRDSPIGDAVWGLISPGEPFLQLHSSLRLLLPNTLSHILQMSDLRVVWNPSHLLQLLLPGNLLQV